MQDFGDIGVAGVLVMLVLREVFNFLKSNDSGDGETVARLDRMEEQTAAIASSTQQMAVLMLKTDDGGTPLVYTPRSLTAAVDALAKNIDRLTDKVDRLA